jgi:hypothetical protein
VVERVPEVRKNVTYQHPNSSGRCLGDPKARDVMSAIVLNFEGHEPRLTTNVSAHLIVERREVLFCPFEVQQVTRDHQDVASGRVNKELNQESRNGDEISIPTRSS